MSGSRSIRQTRKGHSPDRETNRDRQALSAVEGLLSRFSILHGKTTDAQDVGAGGSSVFPHKLGRTPTGWIVVDVTSGTRDLVRVSWNDRTITVENPTASTARGVKLLVY